MADSQEQIARMKKALEPLLNSVPKSLSGASIQVVQQWKKAVVEARKAHDANRPVLAKLTSHFTNLTNYHQGA